MFSALGNLLYEENLRGRFSLTLNWAESGSDLSRVGVGAESGSGAESGRVGVRLGRVGVRQRNLDDRPSLSTPTFDCASRGHPADSASVDSGVAGACRSHRKTSASGRDMIFRRQLAERAETSDDQHLPRQLDERREPSHQLAIAIGVAAPPACGLAAYGQDEEGPAWEIPEFLADQPDGPTIRLAAEHGAQRRELVVVEAVREEPVVRPDGGPLALGRGGFLIDAVEPGAHLLELRRLSRGPEVVVQGLAGLAHPELVGIGIRGHLLEQATALGVAELQQMATEDEAGPGVPRVSLEDGAKQRLGGGGSSQLVGGAGRFPGGDGIGGLRASQGRPPSRPSTRVVRPRRSRVDAAGAIRP